MYCPVPRPLMLVFPTRPSPLYQPPVTSPVGEAGVVAHQAAGRCEIPKWIDRRYAMTCGLCDQLIAPDIEKNHFRRRAHRLDVGRGLQRLRPDRVRCWLSEHGALVQARAQPPARLSTGYRHLQNSGLRAYRSRRLWACLLRGPLRWFADFDARVGVSKMGKGGCPSPVVN
jgi:hypothetical protein